MRALRKNENENALLFLVAFRLVNAFCLRTFFQPDEFFQSLEPAWKLAFGGHRGAWMTWEWTHQLRSSLHPLLFAVVYYGADSIAQFLRLSSATHADLLIAAPKTAQAVVAAVGDFYTWKFARRIYGLDSGEARAALALTVVSPWQWFCSTRTFSNCVETTLTVVALYLWPWQWQWSVAVSAGAGAGAGHQSKGNHEVTDHGILTRLRFSLFWAALACVLRPTNVLIWATLASFVLFRSSWSRRGILAREALLCGSITLTLSALADRVFYGVWTFPPVNFLYFNIAQSLASFYGINNWHYYISQGYPLLLTTALPFTVIGLRDALRSRSTIQTQLAIVSLTTPLALSFISHKEVRFVYPLLPCLHILSSPPISRFFSPATTTNGVSEKCTSRRVTLLSLLLTNTIIALYLTLYHESGPLSVISYLRDQHRIHSHDFNTPSSSSSSSGQHQHEHQQTGISAGFLMPCHSTPWRSHLVYPTIHAWALTCEPPVNLNDTEKASYLDEADQFYANPSTFLRQHMKGGISHIPEEPSYSSYSHIHDGPSSDEGNETPSETQPHQQQKRQHEHEHEQEQDQELDQQKHPWPDYLIFFAQLEQTLLSTIGSKPNTNTNSTPNPNPTTNLSNQTPNLTSPYTECWRTHNTHWHHDWRRRGDIIVWCLDAAEQKLHSQSKHKPTLRSAPTSDPTSASTSASNPTSDSDSDSDSNTDSARERQFETIIELVRREVEGRRLGLRRRWWRRKLDVMLGFGRGMTGKDKDKDKDKARRASWMAGSLDCWNARAHAHAHRWRWSWSWSWSSVFDWMRETRRE